MKTGIELITEERQEHFTKHGRTIESDARTNSNRELRDAASELFKNDPYLKRFPVDWQGPIMAHAMAKSYKDRLVIAGALIAAEIDRIQSLRQ